MHINRHDLLEEVKEEKRLREIVQKAISVIKERKRKQKRLIQEEETKLREIVRFLIKEAKTDVPDEVPHKSTGINVLEDLLKKVIPILEDDYKALTSNDEQRRSFRAHVLKAVINSLAPIVATNKLSTPEDSAESDLMEQDDDTIDVEVGDEDKFIPVRQGDMPEEEAEEEEDNFTIGGTDTTGRNFALQSFNKVESTILDAYESLADDNDRELFYDYLLTNIKLYFDKFEDELKTSFEEPTTDEYEEESTEEPDVEAGIEGDLEPEAGEEVPI